MLDLDTIASRAWMRDNQEVNILGRLIDELMRSARSYFDALTLSQCDPLAIDFDYSATAQDEKELASS
jgi:hypothetical protein